MQRCRKTSDHLAASVALARSASTSPSVLCRLCRSIDREGARVVAVAGGGMLTAACSKGGDSSPDRRRSVLKLTRPRKLGMPVALVAGVLSSDEADEAGAESPNIFLARPARPVSIPDAANGFDSWTSCPPPDIGCICDALLRQARHVAAVGDQEAPSVDGMMKMDKVDFTEAAKRSIVEVLIYSKYHPPTQTALKHANTSKSSVKLRGAFRAVQYKGRKRHAERTTDMSTSPDFTPHAANRRDRCRAARDIGKPLWGT